MDCAFCRGCWARRVCIVEHGVRSEHYDTRIAGQLDQSGAEEAAMVDQLDARILQLLTDEPRVGILEASRRLGVARGTVQARLDKL
ncbi:MAG TPA: AsnC family protein, partial [Jiangellaceae bacterium]|nr:AsnC family protein [Jiangellaceae bacterium]